MIKNLILKFTGFSFVGLFITLVSLLLVFVFIGLLRTPLYYSYVVIYTITIFLSYYINATFVFMVKKAFVQFLKYFLVYILGMFVGMIVLKLLKSLLSYDDWIITCLALPFTTIWNFTFATIVLGGKNLFTDKDTLGDEKKVINNSIILF